MRQLRSEAGFTVMELMIALVIIGVMAMAIAPSLTGALSDNRQNAAMMDVVRLTRKARSLAMSSGVAHLVRFQSAGAGGLGTIELFEGMNNRCTQTPWATAFAASSELGQGALETLDMSYFNPTASGTTPRLTDTGRYVIRVFAEAGSPIATVSELQICYQPNGESYSRLASSSPLVRQMSTAVLVIRRTLDALTNMQGRDRQVMLPAGAMPWIN
jgi:prepilin-type N-terminal cleavage/methylation domain-containing protein